MFGALTRKTEVFSFWRWRWVSIISLHRPSSLMFYMLDLAACSGFLLLTEAADSSFLFFAAEARLSPLLIAKMSIITWFVMKGGGRLCLSGVHCKSNFSFIFCFQAVNRLSICVFWCLHHFLRISCHRCTFQLVKTLNLVSVSLQAREEGWWTTTQTLQIAGPPSPAPTTRWWSESSALWAPVLQGHIWTPQTQPGKPSVAAGVLLKGPHLSVTSAWNPLSGHLTLTWPGPFKGQRKVFLSAATTMGACSASTEGEHFQCRYSTRRWLVFFLISRKNKQ